MKKGYYKANSINGVYFCGETLDEPETEVLSARDFYELLSITDKEITTFMDESNIEIFDQINFEYGIK